MGDVPAPAPPFGWGPGPAHGDLVEIRLGPRSAYVVCHPGLARQVLTDFRLFDRTGLVYERVRTAIGNGLASA
jgi:pentalenene oxygenase